MAMRLHGLPFHELGVEKYQLPGQASADTAQNLQCFGGLHAANDAHQGRQNAQGGTPRFLEIGRAHV